jgi:peptidoglycan/xylan/chitin deacetylase (PgdA/CDA1 family)
MMRVSSALKRKLINFLSSFFFYSYLSTFAKYFTNRFHSKKNLNENWIFPFFKKRTSNNIQILTYHRINNDNDPFFTGIPVNIFESQMRYISSFFHVLSLEEALERIHLRDIPDNAVVVTFDDGYKDVYLNAFPVLKKFSVPATVFLATSAIGNGKILWHDRVFSAFRETQQLLLPEYGKHLQTYPLRTLEEKLIAQHETLKFLWSLDDCKKDHWLDILIKKLDIVDKKEPQDLMMHWDDIKVMHENGISFGSHTVTHPILSRTSSSRVLEEIQISKKVIEDNIKAPIKTFAYPNGKKEDINEEIKRLLKDTGYTCALTTIFGTNTADQDVFELRRGGPWEKHLPAFALQLYWYKFCS